MSFSSDVKALTTKDTGHLIGGRTRLQGIYFVHGNSAGATLTFSDGSTATGTTLLEVTNPASNAAEDLFIPDNGILFENGIHMTNSSTAEITSVTIFYVGGGEI